MMGGTLSNWFTYLIIFSNLEEPIYEVPTLKYTTERILRILLDPDIPTTKICSSRPINITKSATYVIDISKLAKPEDLKSDNFGIIMETFWISPTDV